MKAYMTENMLSGLAYVLLHTDGLHSLENREFSNR